MIFYNNELSIKHTLRPVDGGLTCMVLCSTGVDMNLDFTDLGLNTSDFTLAAAAGISDSELVVDNSSCPVLREVLDLNDLARPAELSIPLTNSLTASIVLSFNFASACKII